jgi:uncharacterized membrane-anchored protein YitT (DUF2179 family)
MTRAKRLEQFGSLVLGNALLAFLVAAFVIPHGIITGGATGLGILIGRLLQVDAALVVLAFNLVMLALGGIVLGRKFLVSTVAGSVLYPVLLGAFQRIPAIGELTEDRMLSTLFAGVLVGLAVGTLVRIGSSTGGTDVLNLVVHKWSHVPFATVAAVTDLVILVAQAIFSNTEQILFGLLMLAVMTYVLDSVMIMGKAQLQVFVISPHHETIRRRLLEELSVGVTMMSIETGYHRQVQQGVLCIVPKRRLHAVHELITAIDPDAFLTITQIKEVHGEGFSRARRYRIPEE